MTRVIIAAVLSMGILTMGCAAVPVVKNAPAKLETENQGTDYAQKNKIDEQMGGFIGGVAVVMGSIIALYIIYIIIASGAQKTPAAVFVY